MLFSGTSPTGGFFMVEKQYMQLGDINTLSQNGEGFSYGMATAQIIGEKSMNRSGRTMIRHIKELSSALELPIALTEPSSVITHDNGNAYAAITIGNAQFFAMARSPLNGKRIEDIVAGKELQLHIVSGPCLFSAGSVGAIGINGTEFLLTNPGHEITESITEIVIQQQLSVYEVESLQRLGSFINAMAKHTKNMNTVFLNLPHGEYYAYILDAYEKGFVSSEIVLSWFSAVDARRERLFGLLVKRITKGLPRDKEINIVNSAPLTPIRERIIHAVEQNQSPSLPEALHVLRFSSELWDKLLYAEKPKAWKALNNLSYVYAELTAGKADKNSKEVQIAVVVENPTESKIFANAKRLYPLLPMKPEEDYNVIAFFPHEHVLPVNNDKKKTMYHVGRQGISLRNARVIFEAYKPTTLK